MQKTRGLSQFLGSPPDSFSPLLANVHRGGGWLLTPFSGSLAGHSSPFGCLSADSSGLVGPDSCVILASLLAERTVQITE